MAKVRGIGRWFLSRSSSWFALVADLLAELSATVAARHLSMETIGTRIGGIPVGLAEFHVSRFRPAVDRAGQLAIEDLAAALTAEHNLRQGV